MSAQPVDPFAGGESVPSLSFKDLPVGTTYTGIVLEEPQVVQARDYETGQPAFWPDGNQKKTIVIRLEVDGEERSLWAPIPSAMKTAIAEAKGTNLIEKGGILAVRFDSEVPNAKNPRLNPQKIYKARYTPPVKDAFAAEAWSAPAPAALTDVPPF